MLRATIKSLLARKLRLLLSGLAVLLGVSFVTGTLVLTRLTVRMEGAFAGNGEGTVEFSATGISTTSGTALVGRPTLTLTFDRTYVVGQAVDYRFQFDVRASAGPGRLGSTADLRNTVNVFADALTPGGFLMSTSGHDYSSNAIPVEPPSPVPEPATGALAVVAAASLVDRGGRAHRRPGAASPPGLPAGLRQA